MHKAAEHGVLNWKVKSARELGESYFKGDGVVPRDHSKAKQVGLGKAGERDGLGWYGAVLGLSHHPPSAFLTTHEHPDSIAHHLSTPPIPQLFLYGVNGQTNDFLVEDVIRCMVGLHKIEMDDPNRIDRYETIVWLARIFEVGRAAFKNGVEIAFVVEAVEAAEELLSKASKQLESGAWKFLVEIHGTSKEELNGQIGEQ